MNEPLFASMQQHMISDIEAHTGMCVDFIGKSTLDPRVMQVMAEIPRHEFVPVEFQGYAYADTPLPIGYNKTISQPFIVALMTDLLALNATDTVLEIGTGLGYQAAVLAKLAAKIYTVDIIEELSQQAQRRFGKLGYRNIETRISDGYFGWPEIAPFDKIIVTAAPDLIPPPLLHQLKPGGRMVIPAGLADAQKLIVVVKDPAGSLSTKEMLPVRFSELESDASATHC